MSDPGWSSNPTETGAYWFQIPGCAADIVWVHDGKVFGVLKTTFDNSVEYGAKMDGLYWGPIERPPAYVSGGAAEHQGYV